MGFRTRWAVTRLASEVGADVRACRNLGRCGLETREARFEQRGYQTRLGAGRAVSIDVRGFESSVAFSLGARDSVNLVDEARTPPPLLAGTPLFVNPRVPSTALEWLADEANARSVAALECSRREPLHVWYAVVMAAVRPGRASAVVLSRVADIADRLKASRPQPAPGRIVDGLSLNVDLIPEDLRHLAPLIEAWSVGDDARRQELIEKARPEERDRLIDAVSPLLDRIDAYLDFFPPNAVPEEAALIARLAEAAAEIGGQRSAAAAGSRNDKERPR
jgi:hypothetical protein